ncbi:MAG TPA: arabinofuranosidase catalytic domain-containing protein, partial [Polyangia bacterium]|nr:arabinofuranosidase catalytic domain-containing protein [Polyangia bacterium]
MQNGFRRFVCASIGKGQPASGPGGSMLLVFFALAALSLGACSSFSAGSSGSGGGSGATTGSGGSDGSATTGSGGGYPTFDGSIISGATPCEILAAAGNSCVAAHSTTRVVYPGYTGPLYQVCKGS